MSFWVSTPHPYVSSALTGTMPCGIGHSERRTLFHETSKLVADKTRAAIDAGLSVILCVGETLEEREAGKTKQVVEDQLKPVIEVLKEADWRCVYRHSSNFPPPPVPVPSTTIAGSESAHRAGLWRRVEIGISIC